MNRRLIAIVGAVVAVAMLVGTGVFVGLSLSGSDGASSERSAEPSPPPSSLVGTWQPRFAGTNVGECGDLFSSECVSARRQLWSEMNSFYQDVRHNPAYSDAAGKAKQVLNAVGYWQDQCQDSESGSRQRQQCVRDTAPVIRGGYREVLALVSRAGE